MVPNGWDVQRIEKFCKISSSKRIMQSDYVQEGVPFYRSKEIILKSKGIEPTDVIYIDVNKFESLKSKFGAPEEGDILISAVGTLGKCYLVKKGENFYFKDGNLLWLKELTGVEQFYLIQYMQSPYFQNEIQNMTGGSSQKALTIIKLAQMSLPLPPLPEQRKIAKILSTWDKAISTTERLIDNSKQQKKALMQQLLTGKKRLLDDSGKPFEGEWEDLYLHDVAKIIVSPVDKKIVEGEIPVELCNYTDVYYNTRITNSIEFMKATAKQSEIDKYTLQVNDVIITKDSETPGDIAIPALVSEDLGGTVCGYHLAIIRPNSRIVEGAYLNYLFSMPKTRYYFFTLATGATRFGLSIGGINKAHFTLPPLEEQQRIAAVLTNSDREIELLEQQLADLKQEKKALMQQLLTGKRRVKVDDKEVA